LSLCPRQLAPHLPLAHSSPAGHLVPQPPQLAGSVLVSVQPLGHAVGWLAAQLGAHTPEPLQTSPSGQTLPQLPQLARAGLRLVQKKELPFDEAQAVDEQNAPPGAAPAQSVPVWQHWSGSLEAQLTAHAPAPLQISPAGQAVPQPPQWLRSLFRSKQPAPGQ